MFHFFCLAQPGEEEVRSTKVKIVTPGPRQKGGWHEVRKKGRGIKISITNQKIVRYQIGKHNTRRREGYATPIFRKSCVQSPSADHQLHCNTLHQRSVLLLKNFKIKSQFFRLDITEHKNAKIWGNACIPHICNFWYANILCRPIKTMLKSTYIRNKRAQMGQNRPTFGVLCAKKYVVEKNTLPPMSMPMSAVVTSISYDLQE